MCYDLFQGSPDGAVIWKGVADCADAAKARLEILSKQSVGAYFAVDTSTSEILFSKASLASRAAAN
jgi:hypothetical protein